MQVCRLVCIVLESLLKITLRYRLVKSTLLDLMSGRKRYDTGGKIALNGHELSGHDMQMLSYVVCQPSNDNGTHLVILKIICRARRRLARHVDQSGNPLLRLPTGDTESQAVVHQGTCRACY